MKRVINIILVSCILFCSSCEKKENPPDEKGEVTVSSEIFGTTVYFVYGYSFEEEKFVPSLNPGSSVADIIPVNELKVTGEVIGMVLSAGPGNSFGFHKNFEGSSLAEAESFYDNYLQVEADDFSELSDTLRKGQVFTFKTYKDNYVKFLIKDVRIMKESSLSDYVEADIKYYIQRDGSGVFDN